MINFFELLARAHGLLIPVGESSGLKLLLLNGLEEPRFVVGFLVAEWEEFHGEIDHHIPLQDAYSLGVLYIGEVNVIHNQNLKSYT